MNSIKDLLRINKKALNGDEAGGEDLTNERNKTDLAHKKEHQCAIKNKIPRG